MTRNQRVIAIVSGGLFLLLATAVSYLAYDALQMLRTPMPVAEDGVVFTVKPGASLNAVAASLARQQLIKEPRYLSAWGRWQGLANQIQAGEYFVMSGQTPVDLLQMLVKGQVVQHALTLIEGWRFSDIRTAIQTHAKLDQTLDGLSDAQVMARLGQPDQHPEGRFLADTYHFPAGTSDIEFLKRAHQALSDLLADEWQQRAGDLPFESADEALILASIVEKETGLNSERAAIAGVFVRRLKKGMRLQADPTVIYALGDDYDGNIRRADLRNPNEYNTYMHRGLPPTPIATAGREAIHATLHPEQAQTLYFVARGDGSHQFSETLEKHNAAVAKYQLTRKGTQ